MLQHEDLSLFIVDITIKFSFISNKRTVSAYDNNDVSICDAIFMHADILAKKVIA